MTRPPARAEVLEPRLLLAPGSSAALPGNVEANLAAAYARRIQPGAAAAAAPAAQPPLHFDDRGRVLVAVSARRRDGVEALARRLGRAGAEVLARSDAHRLVETWIELARLPTVAAMPGVLAVTPVYRPVARAGAAQTQGDAVVNADDVRALGHDGSPALVAAFSDSALSLGASQGTGDLPPVVDRYLEWQAADEGRAMLEIVHDLAPGARLAHHSGFFGEARFADDIRKMAVAGAKVIVDDLWYLAEPFFQDGIIAAAVQDVAAAGVLYVSAAGNDADHAYDAAFADAGAGLHDFDPSGAADTRQRITVPAGTGAVLVFQWDDPFYTAAGVTHDFDLSVYNAAGTLVASAATNNLATQQPLEVLAFTGSGNGQYDVEIRRAAGSGPSRLKYVLSTNGAPGTAIEEFATDSGTVVGHAAAAGAVAVGAVPFYSPTTIEPFSARGDATILFDPAGNRLTVPQVRQKPDVVAPDAVNTSFFGTDIPDDPDTQRNFTGTSAAAPHVAGAAALLLDANPHLTRQELYDVLTSTAADLGAAGHDDVFGFGRVDALAARAAAVALADTTPPAARLLSPISAHGWRVGRIEVGFSEPMDAPAAANAANYALTGAGADNAFGTGDDASHSVAAAYDDDGRTVTLDVTAPSTRLGYGRYRLTLSAAAAALTDPAGNPLNGGGTSPAFEFTVAPRSPVVQLEPLSNLDVPALALRPDGTALMAFPNNAPTVNNLAWPQAQLGQYDPGGALDAPSRSAPTDLLASIEVNFPEAAAGAAGGGGVVAYGDRLGGGIYEINYQLVGPDARPVGSWRTAGFSDRFKHPRVAMNAAGRFAVAFLDEDDDGRFAKGRLFDAAGDPLGGEFRLGPTSSQRDSGDSASVAMAPNGSTVWAWDDGEVHARRYDAAGNPLGPALVVNQRTSGAERNPAVATAADGSFVIAWSQSGGGAGDGGVYVRRYDAAGNPRGGGPTRVSAQGVGEPSGALPPMPHVASAADGRFVVVWRQEDGDGMGVFARRFAADGSPAGDPLWVSEGDTADQLLARVAVLDNGDFVVRWSRNSSTDTTGRARWISWDAPGDALPFGARALSAAASSPPDAPLAAIDVVFDRDMDPATFTAADVRLTDPLRRAVTATSVTTPDNRTFTIHLPPQAVRGRFALEVGPDIRDFAGRAMNQDGDAANGEPTDVFAASVYHDATAASFPYAEGFEAGAPDAIGAEWAFDTRHGFIEVHGPLDGYGGPHSGAYRLFLTHGPFTTSQVMSREAVLKLDLSTQSTATDLSLEFWVQAAAETAAGGGNVLRVDLSGDGATWSPLPGADALNPPTLLQYVRGLFDLDAVLAGAAIARDADVYLRFTQMSGRGGSTISLDDVRVTRPSAVAGRRVFYNNSSFDGKNPSANPSDDAAIATDKSALLPGGTATFANYTSYDKGINGVMVDVAGLPQDPAPTAADFAFRAGNTNDPSTWAAPATPPTVTVRRGAGVSGSDRVTLTWPDGAVKKTWLQVTMLATANTAFAAADAFFFGNAVGESGNNPGNAVVNFADEHAARTRQRSTPAAAPVTSRWDYNRDGRGNHVDPLVARGNKTTAATGLRLISVPGAAGVRKAIVPRTAARVGVFALPLSLTPIARPAATLWEDLAR